MKDLHTENYKTLMKEIKDKIKFKKFHVNGLEEILLSKCSYYLK